MNMQIRRVVTGHDADDRSVFVSDDQVEALGLQMAPGITFHRLWGSDEVPSFPDTGAQPEPGAYFPPVGGFRFGIFTLAAGDPPISPDLDIMAAMVEAEQKVPGLLQYMDPADPGMHTTDTIDFEVVLSGEVVLELDGGVEKLLRAGDTVVQNGTRHRWHNRGTVPAVLALFTVGAEHRNVQRQ